MTFDPEGYSVLLATYPAPLRPGEPNDYIIEHTLDLRRADEEPGPTVARVEFAKVHCRLAIEQGARLLDVFDAESEDYYEVYTALFDPDTEEPRDSLGLVPGDLLYIESIAATAEGADLDFAKIAAHLVEYLERFYADGLGGALVFLVGPDDGHVVPVLEERGFARAAEQVWYRDCTLRPPPLPNEGS